MQYKETPALKQSADQDPIYCDSLLDIGDKQA